MSEENQNKQILEILHMIVQKIDKIEEDIELLCLEGSHAVDLTNTTSSNIIKKSIDKLNDTPTKKKKSNKEKFLTEKDITPLVSRLYHLDLDVEEFRKKLDRMEDK